MDASGETDLNALPRSQGFESDVTAETTSSWSFSMPDEGEAFPEQLAEALWSWLECGGVSMLCSEFARPRSKDQLRIFINCACQASLQTEEGRPVRFHVLFDRAPAKFVARFEDPPDYNAATLVDLAPRSALGFDGHRSLLEIPQTIRSRSLASTIPAYRCTRMAHCRAGMISSFMCRWFEA